MRTIGLAAFYLTLTLASQSRAVTVDTVIVGNPGNVADATGFGGVPYSYRMGTYEVTNSQYVSFLNAVDPAGANQLGLYGHFPLAENIGVILNPAAGQGAKYEVKPGYDKDPILATTWYDAARFVNWLHNGQGGPGTTEDGVYKLLGGTPIPSNRNLAITRAAGARWFLPNEHEWYKAAYHQPAASGGDVDSYWLYPTRSNVPLFSDEPPGDDTPNPSNTGNVHVNDGRANGYNDGLAMLGSDDRINFRYASNVGAYSAAIGPYGTFDQAGNAIEWLENAAAGSNFTGILRGGAWTDDPIYSSATERVSGFRDTQYDHIGFRVAAAVPEPSAVALSLLSLATLGAHARRRTKA